MNILTFNIHHGKGTDGKLNLERIARVIEESRADVVALNEVDKHYSRRSGYIDQLDWLAKRLEMNGVFGAAVTSRSFKGNDLILRQYGNAVLSRYPIVDYKTHSLNVFPLKIEGRALLEASLLIGDQAVSIYATHFSLSPFIQWKQANYILNSILETNQPSILLGDFNTRPHSKVWRKLSEGLTDVCSAASASPCYTFPSLRPTMQLDYIFVSHHLHITSVEVSTATPAASDHLPVKAALEFKTV